MIKGANPNSVVFTDDPVTAVGNTSGEGNVSMSDVIADLRERKKTILEGGINCIPLPFPRFRSEMPGIEQEQYIILTAGTKAGKSQLASFIYLYHTLDYAFEHRDQCSVHIIYFALEESQMRIKQRYISHLLYKIDGVRYSPSDLRSTSADFPIPDEVLDKIETDQYKERLDFFDECVQFETEDTNPTGILRVCEDYAKTVGEYKTFQRKSRSNPNQTVEVFQSYKPYDKKHYKIVLIDHIGLTIRRAI